MKESIQLCTYNRARLLERVLDACFEQSADEYEVVLVNDGSTDDTREVIARAKARATCPFVVLEQANAGLAAGRNNGIAHARGERIIFIDDDVLPLPNFVQEHLRSHDARPNAVVRGGAINVEQFDRLPPPIWSLKNYSGNFFWTTNVSVPLEALRAAGGFNQSFAEYGWEDIDVGLRLRARGIKGVFNRHALVYHYKPRLRGTQIEKSLNQARAQARTAVQLSALHPQWRTYLATGENPVQRAIHAWARGIGMARRYRSALGDVLSQDRALSGRELRVARALASEAYFEELERARAAARERS